MGASGRSRLLLQSNSSIKYSVIFQRGLGEEGVECNAAVGCTMNGWVRKLMNAIMQLYSICNIW